jgi:hypothetical protein
LVVELDEACELGLLVEPHLLSLVLSISLPLKEGRNVDLVLDVLGLRFGTKLGRVLLQEECPVLSVSVYPEAE